VSDDKERVFTLTQRFRVKTTLSDEDIIKAANECGEFEGYEVGHDSVLDALETAVELHHVGDYIGGLDVELHSSQLDEVDPGFF
jgi:hypothetical protein